MIALGLDPGLRETGFVAVRSAGPSLPELLHRETIRAPKAAPPDVVTALILQAVELCLAHMLCGPDVVGVEAFSHRPWVGRAVAQAAQMGRLCARLVGHFERVGLRVVEIDPEVSKAGYPAAERARAALLPRALRNRHERDAFLQAAAACAQARLTGFEAARGPVPS